MVEQGPLAAAVRSAGEPDLKRVVPLHANSTPSTMTQELLHFSRELGMSSPAQPKAMGKKTGPIFACAKVAFGESRPPQIFGAFFPMRIMSVAPEPGRECLFLVSARLSAGDTLILFRFGGKQAFERGTGQFAGVPRVIRANLGIADICVQPEQAAQ